MNTQAITRKHNRRVNDFYPTPAWATLELLKRTNISGTVLECCAGNGDIALEIASIRPTCGYPLKPAVWTADIDPKMPVDLVGDASNPDFWEEALQLEF